MAQEEAIYEELPLTPAVLHIMLALSGGCLHGYAIMKEVTALSEGQVEMGPGTLYGSLKRMVRAGLIEETDPPPDAPEVDGRTRRYYQLTEYGERVLAAELQRMQHLVRQAQARRLLPAES